MSHDEYTRELARRARAADDEEKPPSPHPYYEDSANWERLIPYEDTAGKHKDYPPYALPVEWVHKQQNGEYVYYPKQSNEPFRVVRPSGRQKTLSSNAERIDENLEYVHGHESNDDYVYLAGVDEQKSVDDAWWEYENDEEWWRMPS